MYYILTSITSILVDGDTNEIIEMDKKIYNADIIDLTMTLDKNEMLKTATIIAGWHKIGDFAYARTFKTPGNLIITEIVRNENDDEEA